MTNKNADIEKRMAITQPFYKKLAAVGIRAAVTIRGCTNGADVVPATLYAAGVIPMRDLVDGAQYYGICRNAYVATWHAHKTYKQYVTDDEFGKPVFKETEGVFTYTRVKFGHAYEEDICTIENDNGYDLFLPFEKKEPEPEPGEI